jgi:hypothetical protein
MYGRLMSQVGFMDPERSEVDIAQVTTIEVSVRML